MTIQWFPGHMAKARREVTEKLKLIDIVFELTDARIPMSSRNPMIEEILQNKPKIMLLNKADKADPRMTKEWQAHLEAQGVRSLAINSVDGQGLNQIITTSKEILKEKFDRMKAKGVKPRAIRALIIGIPNVGKSTLINRLAKKNIAKTGDRPGITTSQQWVKVGKELELLDTPGILWPKFEDEQVGLRLAVTGAIKDSIINLQDVAVYALRFLEEHYPERLKKRYDLAEIPEDTVELFDAIGTKRGCLMSGGFINYDKTTEIIIRDIRTEKFGPLTFEKPES
ncbi:MULTISPECIES: ribosome biogenesis GTPase YlqF [Bacillus]|uniref:ribosome biogenesis GTPase YlqF n=1 Tax=Bacillus TaxID=1386 RepID=UPI002116C234|nr:ribosome biogenesis GTPase YlqF [Bacillus altitudinis]MEC0969165.1 ribosome biogenesis GTPase YlqF [Bacillus altitudinis]MEC1002149.1 ribosome biogenesis GTPase YlqF [Bacillus altitudinis]UUH75756.1 ribosome biogenesis GTPase YlqF [Bacillus altitudinis]